MHICRSYLIINVKYCWYQKSPWVVTYSQGSLADLAETQPLESSASGLLSKLQQQEDEKSGKDNKKENQTQIGTRLERLKIIS